jgi:hypothetical protein
VRAKKTPEHMTGAIMIQAPVVTPVILSTQETEIRRIKVRSHPGQIIRETLSQKKVHHKKGLAEWLKV